MKPAPTTLIPTLDTAAPPPAVEPSRARHAIAHVTVEQVAGRPTITRLSAQSPLKLLTPARRAPCATVITSTLGGGLVEGDHLHLHVHATAHTRLCLGTQSSTKVYRCPTHQGCSQHLTLTAADGTLTVLAPDPVTPFAGAHYTQHQSFHLAPTASVVILDWLTSGRLARGERWAFDHYESRTTITSGPLAPCTQGERVRVRGSIPPSSDLPSPKLILNDALRLNREDGPLATPCRTGGFDCFATLILLGPAVSPHAKQLLADISRAPIHPLRPIAFSASPLKDGAIVRIAGPGPEAVGRWIRQRLAFVPDLLGSDPWLRKW